MRDVPAAQDGSPTRYRFAFWAMYELCAALGIAGTLLAIVIDGGGLPDLFGFFFVAMGVAIGMTLSVAVMVAYVTIEVRDDGISGFDFWGRRRFVAWEDINAARPINVAGLRYLRAFSVAGKAPLWIPLFLAKQRVFEDQVIALTPQDNPIRVFLASRPHSD